MNNLQTSFILLTHHRETMPEWMKAERYNYCEGKGILSLFHFLRK